MTSQPPASEHPIPQTCDMLILPPESTTIEHYVGIFMRRIVEACGLRGRRVDVLRIPTEQLAELLKDMALPDDIRNCTCPTFLLRMQQVTSRECDAVIGALQEKGYRPYARGYADLQETRA